MAGGRVWLIQSEGPVWAERETAGDQTSILYSALGSPPERLRGRGGHVASLSREALEEQVAVVTSRLVGPGTGGDDPDAGG